MIPNGLPQLDFMQAVQLSIKRIKEMDGRSRRSEFWWTMLALVLCNIVLIFIPVVGPILSIALWVCSIPLMSRRLHDTGRNHTLVFVYIGLYVLYMILFIYMWFQARNNPLGLLSGLGAIGTIYTLVMLAMIVIGIILIVFCCGDSQPFTNQYGPSPKYPDGQQNQQQFYGQQYGPQQPPYGQQYGPQQPPYGQQYGPQQPPYNQQQYGPQQPPYDQTQFDQNNGR